jgi:hypothetical protein
MGEQRKPYARIELFGFRPTSDIRKHLAKVGHSPYRLIV